MSNLRRRPPTPELLRGRFLRSLARGLLPEPALAWLRSQERRWHRALFQWRYGATHRALGSLSERRAELESGLAPLYERYVTEVSRPEAAISLECAVLLRFLCESRRPLLVWDLGSGFSSLVFGSYKKENPDLEVRVLSCDEDPFWLNRTREFLQEHEVATEYVGTWADLERRHGDVVPDVVLLDYTIPQRLDILRDCGRFLGPQTVLCLDDTHKGKVRLAAEELIVRERLRFVDLVPWTEDRYGRSQWLIFRNPSLLEPPA